MKFGIEGVFGRTARCGNGASMTGYSATRRSPRLFWTASAIIYADGVRHIGLVRDISAHGIGFFSDFVPTLQTDVEVAIQLPHSRGTLVCAGTVARVDPTSDGAATRIGISIRAFSVQATATADPVPINVNEVFRLVCERPCVM